MYETFTSRVAQGRGLTPEHVHDVARGRVWTGADAYERGLVDELGGFTTAINLAKQIAGVKPEAPVKLLPFPKKQSPLSRLRTPKRESSDDLAALDGAARHRRPAPPPPRRRLWPRPAGRAPLRPHRRRLADPLVGTSKRIAFLEFAR